MLEQQRPQGGLSVCLYGGWGLLAVSVFFLFSMKIPGPFSLFTEIHVPHALLCEATGLAFFPTESGLLIGHTVVIDAHFQLHPTSGFVKLLYPISPVLGQKGL